MAKKIFINLPIKNLENSVNFFKQLQFNFNDQFSDNTSACMVIEDNIFVMLLQEEKFKNFTKKPISDATKATEVLLALEVDSKEEVQNLVQKAVDAGGSIYAEPMDHGWMYGHSFADVDGHQWEVFFMDQAAMPKEGNNDLKEWDTSAVY